MSDFDPSRLDSIGFGRLDIRDGEVTWDRDRPWRVERHHHNRARVRIRFAAGQPTLVEIAAVRKAFPAFAHLPPREVQARLASGELDLGEVGGIEAGWLARAAAEAGLSATVERWVAVSYLIIAEAVPAALLIEDEAEARLAADAMIAAGVKVVDVIAD